MPKGRKSELSQEVIEIMAEMHRNGKTYEEIGADLRVNRGAITVKKYLERRLVGIQNSPVEVK